MMDAVRRDIISRLEKDILPLEGLKRLCTDNNINIGFRDMENAFPNSSFPVGCVHEFLSASRDDRASTNGFVAVLLSKLMQLDGPAIWVSTSSTIFPSGIKAFDVNPEKIIFVQVKKEKDVLYALEESLGCKRIGAVAGEIKQITFKESRRLQLAAEQSRVTGLLIRHQPKILNTIACVSRWCITSLPSELNNNMPGVGFPRWSVELVKVRNGKPNCWELEWAYDGLHNIRDNDGSISQQYVRKAG